jgi:hypothetical protein
MACVNVTSQGAKEESHSHLQADVLRVFSLRVQELQLCSAYDERPAGRQRPATATRAYVSKRIQMGADFAMSDGWSKRWRMRDW